jgi:endonuclease III
MPPPQAGVSVDTHVARLSQRLQLSRHGEARRIEPDLMALGPQAEWPKPVDPVDLPRPSGVHGP